MRPRSFGRRVVVCAIALLVAGLPGRAPADSNEAPGLGSAFQARITAGGLHTCALLSTGTIRCWGYNEFEQGGHGHGHRRAHAAEIVHADVHPVHAEAEQGKTGQVTAPQGLARLRPAPGGEQQGGACRGQQREIEGGKCEGQ